MILIGGHLYYKCVDLSLKLVSEIKAYYLFLKNMGSDYTLKFA